MTEPAPAPRPAGPRLLGLAVVGLLAAALALWSAAQGTWLTATWESPLRGTVTATAAGADAEPILVPWALLALAAVGGLLATSGRGRQVVGIVVGLAGLWALLRAVSGLAAPAPDLLPAAATRPGRAVGVEVTLAWPLVAAVGGALLVGVGVLVAVRGAAMPRLGARYDAPTGAARRSRPDDDRDLWTALDAGEDPTRLDPDEDRDGRPGEGPAARPGTGRAPDRGDEGRG